MEPLTVEVDVPSSSMAITPRKNGPDHYEVVNYGEILFPDFRHVKRLGRGAYGTVVECFFRGRPAAAKLVENGNDHAQIRSEAELLHGFRHRNIIKLYALFHGEMSGLVLELMEGRSLSELLHQHKHITYQACHILCWAHQVCEALSYLHAHNFIHRDIKPSNMLLTRDYKTLKLCDFGTVAELKTSMTDNRGTAAWMAPEVFRGRRYDQKCDIFSLGISLWEMMARRQPFTDLNETNPVTLLWKVAENGLRPPRIKDLPKQLMDLIERCWLNSPDERPCLEEVQKTIEAFIEIFPDASLLPLVDRTTAKQALAESAWEKCQQNQQHQPHPSAPAQQHQPVVVPTTPPTYYTGKPSLVPPPPTINVQKSNSPIPTPQPPSIPHTLHSTQSQFIILPRTGSHLQLPGHPFHQGSMHPSHSLLDLSSHHSTMSSSSNSAHHQNYTPCLSPPLFVPPENYPHLQPPASLYRANSLPPPDARSISENQQLGREKKRKSSYIRRFFGGLKNF